MFKVHFGKVTLKAFTKGEHVLRFEAIVHNAATPCTGRVLLRFPALAARLRDVADRWLETIQYLDQAFVADETLDQLPTSAQLGRLSIGGFDLNKPHMRAMLGAAIACAQIPMGARLGDLVPRVPLRSGTLAATYGTRQAAYDLRSLRAKPFVRRASSLTAARTHQTDCAPSPPWSYCASRSSSPSLPMSVPHTGLSSPRPGLPSTTNIKPFV